MDSNNVINHPVTQNPGGDFQNTKILLDKSSPLYLLVSEGGELKALGSLWGKVTSQSEFKNSFEEEFILVGYENFVDLKNRYSKGNVLFFNHRKSGLKFKSSFFRFEYGYVFLVNPVVNSDYPLKAFHMDLNDFAEHTYIAESIFLSEISLKGLHEAQELNIKINKRNTELKNSLEKVEKLRLDLEQFNLNLERLVEEKTQENVSLQSNLNEIEKFVAIGEMTMGIAHDLNNPLSAILIGIQNLTSSIEILHQNLIYSFSKEEIAFADEHSKTSKSRAFLSTLQMIKERKGFQYFLEEQKGYSADEAFEIADRMVKAAIDLNDISKIDKILEHRSPKTLLDLMYHLSIIHQMVTTISIASTRSAEVVSDLRKFTKGAFEQEKLAVNLLESINSVLRVLSSNYKSNINFEIDVPEDLEIQAIPRELFQIWSNVIKNGIEAIGNQEGTIWIRVQKTGDFIKVEFENNGPKIPEEHIHTIFDRFKSSKGVDNFGYGLNIVKKILESNQWQVEVRSDENSTAFSFILKT